jgi:hypothetical protein
MGFLLAELALMLMLAAAAGAALMYWKVRHQFRDASNDFFNLRKELDAAQLALTKSQQAQLDQVQSSPSTSPVDVARSSQIGQLERKVTEVNDAGNARSKALEHQLRNLTRQIQEALPHPIDAEELARRLDTLGAAMPQARLGNVESRLVRVETMLTSVCTQLGAEIPPAVATLTSRLPGANTSAPSYPATGSSVAPKPPALPSIPNSSPRVSSNPPMAHAPSDADTRSAPRPKTSANKSSAKSKASSS